MRELRVGDLVVSTDLGRFDEDLMIVTKARIYALEWGWEPDEDDRGMTPAEPPFKRGDIVRVVSKSLGMGWSAYVRVQQGRGNDPYIGRVSRIVGDEVKLGNLKPDGSGGSGTANGPTDDWAWTFRVGDLRPQVEAPLVDGGELARGLERSIAADPAVVTGWPDSAMGWLGTTGVVYSSGGGPSAVVVGTGEGQQSSPQPGTTGGQQSRAAGSFAQWITGDLMLAWDPAGGGHLTLVADTQTVVLTVGALKQLVAGRVLVADSHSGERYVEI